MMKSKFDITKYAPPGMQIRQGITAFFIGYAGVIFISMGFFFNLSQASSSLYEVVGGERILIPGRMMDDFVDVLDNLLAGFVLIGLVLIEGIIYQYLYFNGRGSKSLYVMKRLPNRWELHKRCWSLPLAGMILCGITAFVLLLIYFGVYMAVTPSECLVDGQWQKIWREFR